MPEALVTRFKRFMGGLPMAEEIDFLPLPAGTHTEKKADYFLESRKVIVELKSFEQDPEHKVASELNRHRSRKDYPLFYGRWPISDVLNHLPDGQAIKQTIFAKVSRSIKRSVRDANGQIASTKRIFDCEGAWGVVVLLNETINILDPKVIMTRVNQLLLEKDSAGAYGLQHIHAVWILPENYALQSDAADGMIPTITLYRPDVMIGCGVCCIIDGLYEAWAAFNRVPLLHMANAPLDKLEFTPLKKQEQASNGMIPRHESWRRAYREEPYLRNLSDEALLRHGAKLMNAMTPHLLKGGPRAPFDVMAEFWVGWTHFLEECDLRRLDMKPFLDLIRRT